MRQKSFNLDIKSLQCDLGLAKKTEIVSNPVKGRAPEIPVNESGNVLFFPPRNRACRILSNNVQNGIGSEPRPK